MRFRSSVMELARAAGVAGRWHAEQSIAPCGQPGIKNWPHFREWPNRKNRHQPLPTRQHPNDFDPCEVTFAPTAVGIDFDFVSLFHLAKRRPAAIVKSNLMAGSSPPLNNDFTLNVLCQPHD